MSFDLILDFMSLSPENLSFWHKNSKLYAYVKCSSLIRGFRPFLFEICEKTTRKSSFKLLQQMGQDLLFLLSRNSIHKR